MTIRSSIDEITKFIDTETEPSRMSKDEALDVLEQVIDELKGRCEALRDEIEAEDAEDAQVRAQEDDDETDGD